MMKKTEIAGRRTVSILLSILIILYEIAAPISWAEENDGSGDKEEKKIVETEDRSLKENVESSDNADHKDNDTEDQTDKKSGSDKDDLPEKDDADDQEEDIEENKDKENKLSGFSEEVTIGGITVKVKAPEGSLPEGAILDVEHIRKDDDIYDDISKAVEDERDKDSTSVRSYIFDVRILDEDGNEVQPDEDVEISFSGFSENLTDNKVLDGHIYHIKEKKKDLVAEELEEEKSKDTYTAITDGFSYYTVDFTYNSIEYSIEGESEAKVEDVLEQLGIPGHVTFAEGSNDDLFSFEERDGEWYIISHKPFQSTEWMKVVAGGIEYEIVVTDGNQYTVTLHYNDGTGRTTSLPVEVGKQTSNNIEGSIIYRPGYQFARVWDDPTGGRTIWCKDGVAYDRENQYGSGSVNYWNAAYTLGIYRRGSAKWKYEGNVNAYCHWDPNSSHTVTYNPNGGSVSTTSQTFLYGETLNTPIPTKQGYTFKGWYTPINGSSAGVLDMGHEYHYGKRFSNDLYAPSSGTQYLYRQKDFTAHCSAYMDDWSTLNNSSTNYALLSCTQSGGWCISFEGGSDKTLWVYVDSNGKDDDTYGINTGIHVTDIPSGWNDFDVVCPYASDKYIYVYLNGVQLKQVKAGGATDAAIVPYQYHDTAHLWVGVESNDSGNDGNYFPGLIGNVQVKMLGSMIPSDDYGFTTPDHDFTLYAAWEPNPIAFSDQTINKDYSALAQTAAIVPATNGTGTYTYTKISEQKNSTNTNYMSISGSTINIAAGTPKGTYTMVVRAADSNSGSTKDATYTINVAGQPISPTVTMNGWTYGGTPSTPSVSGNPGGGAVTYHYKVQGAADSTYTTTRPENAGSYTVRATVAETTIYDGGTATANFTIGKANISPTVAMSGWTYGGTASNPSVTGNTGSGTVTYEYKVQGTADSTYTATKPSTAGNYTVRATIAATTNYNSGTATANFTIAKAANPMTYASTQSVSKTFSTASQTATLSAASNNQGSVSYAINSQKNSGGTTVTYFTLSGTTLTVAANTPAGTYTVVVRATAAGNDNYNSGTKDSTVTVTVGKASISPTVSMSGWTYGGTASTPSVSGNTGGGSVTYEYKVSTAADSTYTTTKPSNAGTYTVRATIAATSNYNGGTATANFTIAKAANPMTYASTQSVSKTFSTASQTATLTAAANNQGSVSYAINSQKTSGGTAVTYFTLSGTTLTLAANTPAGTYTVVVRATAAGNDNYNSGTKDSTVTVTVGKAANPLTYTSTQSVSKSFSTSSQTATLAAATNNQGALSYAINSQKTSGGTTVTYFTLSGTTLTIGANTPVGTYTVVIRATAAGNDNYNSGTKDSTVTVSIGKAAISPTVSMANWTYGGTASNPSVSGNPGSGTVTYHYKVQGAADSTYSTTKPSNAGSYTVRATVAETTSYQGGTATANFTISKAANPMTYVSTQTVAKPFNTASQTATLSAASGAQGTLSYAINSQKTSSGTTVTYFTLSGTTLTLAAGTPVGTYTVVIRATAAGNDNYNSGTKDSTVTVTVNKAAISPTVSMSDWTYGGTASNPSVTGNPGSGAVTYEYKVQGAADSTYSTTKPSNAGSYTVRATVAETASYQGGTATANFTIAKKEVTLSWGTASWVYDGSAHSTTCTAGGLVSGDTCTVTLSGNSVGPNVGSATVTATGLSNGNYKLPSTKTKSISITRASVGAKPTTSVSKTYNGNEQNNNYTTPGGVSMTGSNKGTNVGDYVAKYTPDGNHMWSDGTYGEVSVTLTINEATMTVTPTAYSGAYNGSAHAAQIKVNVAGATVEYGTSTSYGKSLTATNANTNYTMSEVAYTDFTNGAKTVYYRVSKANYTTVTGTTTITISKASISPTVTLAGWTYGGTANNPSTSGNSGGGSVTYEYKVQGAADSTYTTTKPTNAGDYTVRATVGATTNYNSGTATANFTIAKKEVTLSWGTSSWTYDGNSHSTTCTANGLVGSDTCTVTLSGNSVGPNVGSATVTASSLSNSNYKLPSANTKSISVTRASVGAKPTTSVSKTYNSSEQNNGYTTPGGVSMTGSNKGTNVGSYVAKYTPDGNHMWSDGTYGEVSVTLTIISNATMTATPTAYSGAYNGSAHSAQIKVNIAGATVEYGTSTSYGKSLTATDANTNYTMSEVAYTDFTNGAKTVYYRVSKANYTTVTGTTTITISKANISPSVTLAGWTYGGTANSPSVTGNSGGGTVTYEYKVQGTADSTYTTTKPSNAGSYTVRASIAATTNYNAGSATANFTISKANISPSVSMSGWTYGGTASTPSVSGNTGGGSVTYEYKVSTAADSTYTTTKPSNAGTYTVRASIAATSNYNSGSATTNFTISKSTISPTVTMNSWTYGGTASNPSVSGNTGGGTVTYEYKVQGAADSTYTTTKPSNAGSYTVRATIAATSNYNSATATANFTINKANISPSVSMSGWTYGGTASTPSVSGNPGSGSVTYEYKVSTAADSTYTTTKPSNAGTFTVRATVAATSNYNGGTATANFTISKAANPLSYTSTQSVSKTFSTSAQTATLTAATGAQGTLSYAINSQKNSDGTAVTYFTLSGTTLTLAANTPAGTYTVVVRATAAGNDNYNSGTKDSTVTVTVGKAANPLSYASTQSVSKTFSTSSQTATLTAATGAQGTLSYAINSQKNSGGTAVTYFTLSGTTLTLAANTPAGTYTVVVRATAAGNDNYNSGTKDSTVTVTVGKAANPLSYASTQSVSKTFSTSSQTATLTAATGAQGTLSYAINSQKNSGETAVTYFTLSSTTLTLAANTPAGTYTVVVRATATGNDNYNSGTKDSTVTVTVNKAAISPSVSMAGWTYGGTASNPSVSGNPGGGSVTYQYKVSTAADSTYSATKPSNVGTYTVKATVAETSNYQGGTATTNFTIGIAPNPLTFTTPQNFTKTFSTSSQTITLTAAANNQGTLSYAINSQKTSGGTTVSYFTLSGTTLTMAANTPAGSYTVVVRATAAGNSNYSSGTKDATVNITVNKASNPISYPSTQSVTKSFSTTAQTATLSAATGQGTISYAINSQKNSGGTAVTYFTLSGTTLTVGANTPVGTYTVVVRATAAGNDNYNSGTADSTVTVTVNKAAISPSVSMAGWTYGGTASNPSVSGNPGSGTVAYTYKVSTAADSTYSATKPSNAGTYTVKAVVAETANYQGGTATTNFTIAKAANPMTYTATQSVSKSFSTSAQTATLTAAANNQGTLSYAINSQKNSGGTAVTYFTLSGTTLTLAANTPAGTYTVVVRATAAGNDNYNSGTKDSTVTITVGKAAISPTVSMAGWTYGETASIPSVSGNPGGGAVAYVYKVSTAADSTYTSTKPTNAGTYTVKATIDATANYQGGTATTNFTIAKAANPMTYTATQSVSKTFSTSSQTATLTAATNNQGTLSYAINSQKNSGGTTVSYFTLSGTTLTLAANTPAGTYTVVVRATAAGNDNYNSSTKDSTVTVTVGKAANPLSYTSTQSVPKSFSTSAQTATLAAATNNQGTLSYAINSQKNSGGTAVTYFTLSGTTLTIAANTPIGTYTVVIRATAAGNDNYNSGTKDSTVTVTVGKAAISPTVSMANWTYGGTASTPSVSGNPGSGAVTYEYKVQGAADSTYSTTKPSNAGSYTVRATVAETTSYQSGTATANFTIAKASNPMTYVSTQSVSKAFSTSSQTATLTAAANNQGSVSYAITSQKTSGGTTVTYFTLSGTTLTLAASTPVGTYTVVVRATAAGNDNYNSGTKDSTVTVTVNKAAISPTVSMPGWTYGGTASNPSTSGNPGSGTVTYQYKVQGAADSTYTTTKPSNAGSYTVKATVAETASYQSGTATANFTIAKASNPMTYVSTQSVSKAFSTSSQTAALTAAANNQGSVSYAITSQKTSGGTTVSHFTLSGTTLTLAASTPVGTYTVVIRATAAGNDNYNSGTKDSTVTVTVGKAAISPTVSMANWTYGGTASTPSVSGNPGSGAVTYEYKTQGAADSTYTTTKPSNAGSYTVRASVAETTSYQAGTATANFTINRANISPTVSMANWTYGGTASTPTVSGNPGGGTVTYEYKVQGAADSTYTTTKPSNAGSYTVRASIAQTANYNAGTATANFTINNASMTVTPTAYSAVYDGSAHSAQIKVNIEGATVEYGTSTSYGYSLTATNANTNYAMSSVTRTNADGNPGVTTVYYRVTKANYTTVTGSTTISISKKSITPVITIADWAYGGTASTPSVSGNTGSGTVTYYYKLKSAADSAYTTTKPSDAGKYTIKAVVAETTNYQSGTATKDFNITFTATPTAYSGTYDGSSHSAQIKTSVSGAVVSYGTSTSYGNSVTCTNANTNYAMSSVSYTDFTNGAKTVYYSATKNGYTVTGTTSISISNSTMVVTPTAYNAAYDGVAHSAQIKVNVAGATVEYGTSSSYGKSLTATNANTNYTMSEVAITNVSQSVQTVYYRVTKANYTTVTGTTTITITKKSISPTVSMSGWTYGGTASTPTVSGNPGVGSVTYEYKVSTAADSTYTTTKPTNAGTYTVRATVAETANYQGGTATANFTITKAANPMTYTSTQSVSKTFSTSAQTATLAAAANNQGSVSYAINSQKNSGGTTVSYFSLSGTTLTVEASAPAGTYTVVVRATAAGNDNYNSGTKDSTVTVTVNKAAISPSVSMSGWTYDGTASTPSVSGNPGSGSVTYEYKVSTAADSTYTTTKPSNAGTYTVKATVAETANYQGGTATANFTIAKAANPMTYASTQNVSKTFSTSAQTAVLASAANNQGSVSYAITSQKQGSTDVTYFSLSGTTLTVGASTPAGTYTVVVRATAAGNDNYNSGTKDSTVTVTVGKAANPMTYVSTQTVSKAFSTSAQTATLASAANNQGSVSYAITSQKQGSTDVTYFSLSGTTLTVGASTPAGTYTVVVRATAAGNDNYNSGTKDSTVTVTVGKTAISPAVSMSGWTYGGTATSPSTSGNPGGGAVTYQYKVQGAADSTYTDTKPTNAGSYTVKATVAETANYQGGTATTNFTIAKAANPITYTSTQSVSKTFSTAAQTATLTAAANNQGSVSYAINSQKQGSTNVSYFSLSGTTLTVGANTPAGTYTVVVRATAAGNDNYNSGTKDSTVTVTIGKAAISPTVSMSGWTYGGTASNPTTSGNPGGGTVMYQYKVSTAADSTYTDTKPTNAGTYTVKATVAETANYQGGTATTNFTIAKAANPMTYVSTQSVSKTFSTAAQTATLTAAANNQGSVSYAINSQKTSGGTTVSYFTLSGTTLTIGANTPAGTYTVVVRATAAGNDNYNSTTKDSTVTVTIGKAANPLSYVSTQSVSKTFSTSSQTATLTAATNNQGALSYAINSQKNSGGTDVTYFTLSGTTLTIGASTPVGTYTVVIRATAAGNDNYNSGTKDSTVTVTVSKAAISPTVSMPGWTYGGTASNPSVSDNPGSGSITYEYKVSTAADSTYSTTKPSNAGTYTVRATIAETANYQGGTATTNFTIAKAANPMTYASTQSVSKSFSTSAQTAALAEAANNQGAVSYAITSQKQGSTTVSYFTLSGTTLNIAANTPAGTYTVVVKATAAGNDNYNSGAKDSTVTVTIGKASISPTVSMSGWTYGGTATSPSTSGNLGNGAVTYQYKVSTAADSTYTDTKPTNAGTYTVKATVAETANYQGGTAVTNFTIAKVANPMTYASTQSVSKAYSTSAQTATLAAAANNQGSVSYAITSQKQGSMNVSYFTLSGTTLTIGANTPAGTYTVVVRATAAGNDNYNSGTKDSTVTITVGKAAISPTVSMSGWTYGQTANTPSVSGNPGSGTVTYEYKVKDAADSTYTGTKPSNAGTYTVMATVAETANYQSGTATTNFTIAKAANPMTYASTQSVSKAFSTSSQTATLAAASNNQGAVSYAITSQKQGSTDVTHFSLSGTTLTIGANTPAGTYTVVIRATAAGNDNYNSGTKDSTVTVTIGKAAISPTVSMSGWTYGGTASNPSVSGNPGSGAVTYEYKVSTAADSTYTSTKPTNAGTYTVRATVAETANYQSGTATTNFTIAKAANPMTYASTQSVSKAFSMSAQTATLASASNNQGSISYAITSQKQGSSDVTHFSLSGTTLTIGANTPAGTYTVVVRATAAGNDNYNSGTKDSTVTVTIGKAAISPTVSIANWTYGQAASTPSVGGNPGSGAVTYEYKVQGAADSTYTSTKPTNAGAYTIRATVAETANYQSGTATANFTIAKAANPMTFAETQIVSKVYNTSAQTATLASAANNQGAVSYAITSQKQESTGVSYFTLSGTTLNIGAGTPVGTYTVVIRATAAGNDNYNSGTKDSTVTVTIIKAAISPAVSMAGWTYGETASTPSVSGNPGSGTVTYEYKVKDAADSTYTTTKPSNAGTYTVRATVAETANYQSGTATTNFTIAKAANPMTYVSTQSVSKAFSTSAQTAALTAAANNQGAVSYAINSQKQGSTTVSYFTLSGTTLNIAANTPAGTYTVVVRATAAGNDNYNSGTKDSTVTVTIGKAAISPTVSMSGWTYGGTASSPSVSGNSGNGTVTYQYKVSTAADSTYTDTKPTNAGTYTVKATIAETANYQGGTATTNFTIAKAANPMTYVSTQSVSKTFRTSAQTAALTAATGAQGTLSYAINSQKNSGGTAVTYFTLSDTTLTLAANTPAGTYTVVVRATAAGNDNYNNGTKDSTVTVTVGKAAISPTVSMSGWTYGGTASTPSVSGNPGSGTVTYEYKVKDAADSTYTTTKPSNAGTYTVRATVAETANYQGGTATANFTINKASISPTVSIANWTYGGTSSNPSVTGNTGGGAVTYEYKVQGAADSTYTSTKPTSAGNYTVRATVAETANYNGGSATANFSITKANITPTVTISNWTYGGTPSNPSVTGNPGNGEVTYQYKVKDAADSTYTSTKPSNAGNYTIKATIAATANYNGGTATANFTINKASISPTVSIANWTYGETPSNPSVTGNTGGGAVTYEYKVQGAADSTYTGTKPTSAGNYTVRATIAETSNYNSGTATKNFTIGKAPLSSFAVNISNWTYGETPSNPSVTGNTGNGIVTYEYKVQGAADSTYTSTKPTNAGSYTVRATAAETANYQSGTAIKNFTINKATMTITATPYTNPYDGNSHAIKIRSNIAGATVNYGATPSYGKTLTITEANKDYLLTNTRSGDSVERTNVGITDVYYEVVMDNYEPVRGTKPVTITPEFENETKELTYDYGSSQNIAITPAEGGTSYTYTEISEKSGGVDTDYLSISGSNIIVAQDTPAGTYTYVVRATENETGLYTDATYTITVDKADMTVTATPFDGNYDGNAHSAKIRVDVDGAVVSYGETAAYGKTLTASNADTDYALTEASRTATGVTTVYYKVSKANYNDVAGTTTVRITDTERPVPNVVSTNNTADRQTVTLTATDNLGITSYYWGTEQNPLVFIDVTSTPNFSTSLTVTQSGTYYLVVKDAAGNVGTASKTFYETTFSATHGTPSIAKVLTPQGSSFNTATITPDAGYKPQSVWTKTGGTINTNTSYTPSANDAMTAICAPYIMTLKYHVNSGTVSNGASYTHQGVTYMFRAGADSIVEQSIDGGTTWTDRTEEITAETTSYDIWDVSTLGISREGYSTSPDIAYNTLADGTGINISQNYSSTTNQPTIARLNNNQPLTADVTKVIYVNWQVNSYSIQYTGMDGATYGTDHPTTAVYGQNFTVDAPSKRFFRFLGWKITGMDSVTHTYGSSTTTNTVIDLTDATTFKNLRSTSGTVTFEAQWEQLTPAPTGVTNRPMIIIAILCLAAILIAILSGSKKKHC